MNTLDIQLTDILADGVASQRFPGATLAWQRHYVDAAPAHVAVGRYTYAADAPAMTVETYYDQASLTKIVTATAALRLWCAGEISIDDPIQRFWPQSQAHGVTIRHLLTHTAALDVRLSTLAQAGADVLWSTILATTPTHTPGTQVAYANVNTLLLGEIVAQVSGMPLAEALTTLVLEPAQMRHTRFNPPAAWHAQTAPSESTATRGTIQGIVHDESCAVLGGVAGHAGLFGTATDMVRFGMAWLDTLAGASPWQIRAEIAQQALCNHSPQGQLGCGWGWMLARPQFMGDAVPHMAAHTGFTGPVVAIVPDRRLAWALMSNRTWPERTQPPQHHSVTAQVSSVLYHWADTAGT